MVAGEAASGAPATGKPCTHTTVPKRSRRKIVGVTFPSILTLNPTATKCRMQAQQHLGQIFSPAPSRPGRRLLCALHQPLPRHVHRVPRRQRQSQRANPVRLSSSSRIPHLALHRLKQGRHLLVESAASNFQHRLAGRGRAAAIPGLAGGVPAGEAQLEREVVLWVFDEVGVYRGTAQALGRPGQLVPVEVGVKRVGQAGRDLLDSWELRARLLGRLRFGRRGRGQAAWR